MGDDFDDSYDEEEVVEDSSDDYSDDEYVDDESGDDYGDEMYDEEGGDYDEAVETEEVGYGEGIMDSIKGVLVGIVLFFASFVVLWMNEGRTDMSKVAKKAISIKADAVDTSAEGKLVSVSGILKSDEKLGDTGYIKPGNYIKLIRKVEMYAWVEKRETKTKKKLGGKKIRVTKYKYRKQWTANPADSSSFKKRMGHRNPQMKLKGKTFTVTTAKVGVYVIDPRKISLPAAQKLTLTNDIVEAGKVAKGGYIFEGKGTLERPQVGDLRISYSAVKSGIEVTAFGKLSQGKIVPYVKGDDTLYRIVAGTRDESVQKMHKEYTTTGWVMRVIGFLMMWIGLNMFFGPINAVLDVVPFLGSMGRAVVSIATFIVALILSIITIIISMIAHNIYALIAVIIIIAGAFYYIYTSKKKKKAASA